MGAWPYPRSVGGVRASTHIDRALDPTVGPTKSPLSRVQSRHPDPLSPHTPAPTGRCVSSTRAPGVCGFSEAEISGVFKGPSTSGDRREERRWVR
uniref:Uncharacterized protein n=1 Tax=Knipowitschia caucasica TaxID=637954 RepID=A0AAV2M0U6_KNICA